MKIDSRLRPIPLSPEAISSMNLSGRLDLPLAGHLGFVVSASALYSCLYVASVWTELGYAFDRLGPLAMMLSPLVLAWAAVVTAASLALLATSGRSADGMTVTRGLTAFLTGIATLLALLALLLPGEATIMATFPTRAAFTGYFKNVGIYFVPLGLAYLLWPFHVVVGLQREIAHGRWSNVLKLLNRDPSAFHPVGVWFVEVRALGLMLIPAVVIAIGGTSYLLDNLIPGPYGSLFTTALYVRVILWFSVATVGLLWYARCLNDLKREAILAERLHSS